jgi:hypothetical protein
MRFYRIKLRVTAPSLDAKFARILRHQLQHENEPILWTVFAAFITQVFPAETRNLPAQNLPICIRHARHMHKLQKDMGNINVLGNLLSALNLFPCGGDRPSCRLFHHLYLNLVPFFHSTSLPFYPIFGMVYIFTTKLNSVYYVFFKLKYSFTRLMP